jgi:hypothetical protein
MSSRSVRATRTEARQPLPGDDLIPKPVGSLTHAVTIKRPRHDVWPWLAQMGAGSRAGWYSYDFLDNGRQPSARRIVPELQSLTAGMVFPAVPGATDGFTLLAFEPERFLVLGWLSPDRSPLVTWAFVLQELAGSTRLIVRARGGPAYAFHGLPPWISQRLIRVVHFVMQQKQLIGIADRAERSATLAAIPDRPGTREGLAPDRVKPAGLRAIAKWTAVGTGLIAGAYGSYVLLTWARYGRVRPPSREEEDSLLDRFMPTYDVVDRHRVRVEAPAVVALAIAREMELFQLPVVRAIVRGRELVLRAGPDNGLRPRGLLAEAQSLGWGVLADVLGREIVVGAVTRPWEAKVTFRSVPASDFAAFAEPDYVRIAWTLRADPLDETSAVFRTETRVLPTDAVARAKFRRYWPFFSPGMKLIRRMELREVKSQAAHRARGGVSSARVRVPSRSPERGTHAG